MHGTRKALLLLLSLLMLMQIVPAQATSVADVEVVSAPLAKASVARSGMVRVYLSSLGSPTLLNITVAGSYTADGAVTDVTLNTGAAVAVSFDASSGNITMNHGGITYAMGREMIFRRHVTTGSNGLKIAQAKKPANLYPGDLRLLAQSSGSGYKLYAIASVYMEYYLSGVVPYEMGDAANIEALKAQAVAARTYTLNKMNLRSDSLYDVVDTTNDQVYYGNSDSTTNCTAAVNATKGIVLMNGSTLTGTYYTASNGGQIESARNAWGSSGYDYLGVKDDPFDLMNTASIVKSTTVYADNANAAQPSALKTLLTSKTSTALTAKGYNTSGLTVTQINSITPHTPKYASPSRLYTKMDFSVTASCSSGTATLTVTCDIFSELESALSMGINGSSNELWSVTKLGSNYLLQARRYGHGIGMSQRGAMQMGALGYTYDQIVGFYYPGCIRMQYTFTHTILSAIAEGGGTTITTTEDPADITESSGVMATVKLVGVQDMAAVRGQASSTGTVLTSVVNGSIVTVLARGDSWTLIRIGRIVGYLPTSALTFSGTPPTTSAETPTVISQWATVSCVGTLNLRESASSGAAVVTNIPNGAILSVFSVSGGWANVQYGAYTGYASTDFLTLSSAYPGTVTEGSSSTATVKPSSVELRATASTTGTSLRTLTQGTQVTVTANDGSWCAVTVDGASGYIMTADLSFGGASDATPTPSQPTATPSLGSGEVEAVIYTTADYAAMFTQASEASTVLATIPRGESVIVTSRGNPWCAVRYGSQNGYVRTVDLRFPSDGGTVIGYAQVTTISGSLNLRSQPTAGSTILTKIPRLARVEVLARGTGWTNVRYSGLTGYVMTMYLTMEGSSTPPSATDAPGTLWAKVTTPSGALNLRAEASSRAKVLTTIPQSTRIQILARLDTWSQTAYNGKTGYVMNSFLEFEAVATATPAPPVTTVTPEPGTSATPAPSATPTPAPTATPTPAIQTATVATGGGSLNMRLSASLYSPVVAHLPNGAQVTVVATDAIWTTVRYGGLAGFVMTRYLQMNSTGGGTGSTVATVWTVSGSLNLRQQAQSGAKVLLRIPRLAQVTVLDKGTAWCRVTYQQTTGYAMTAFLSFPAVQTATPAPTATPTAAVAQAWVMGSAAPLSLRAEASNNANVLATLAADTQVAVLSRGSEWCSISVNGMTGFVATASLTWTAPGSGQTTQPTATTTPSTSATPTAQPQTTSAPGDTAIGTRYVVTPAGPLNLREIASTTAKVVAEIPQGSAVKLLQEADEWCRVQYGDAVGYAMTKFLATNAPGAESATNPPQSDATATPAPNVTEAPVSPTDAAIPTSFVVTPETAAPSPTYDPTLTDSGEWDAVIAPPSGTLNMRQWCATDAPVIAELSKGAVVQVLQVGDDWCTVLYGELKGYCKTEYLTFQSQREPEN